MLQDPTLPTGSLPGTAPPDGAAAPAAVPDAPEASAPAAAAPETGTRKLKTEIEQLKKQIEDLTTRNLPERERWRKTVDKLTGERDSARRELSAIRRREAVKALAAQAHFDDPDYLDFLLHRQEIDPEDQAAAEAYLKELAVKAPRRFTVALKSGGGSAAPDPHCPVSGYPGGATGIAAMLANAPELH